MLRRTTLILSIVLPCFFAAQSHGQIFRGGLIKKVFGGDTKDNSDQAEPTKPAKESKTSALKSFLLGESREADQSSENKTPDAARKPGTPTNVPQPPTLAEVREARQDNSTNLQLGLIEEITINMLGLSLNQKKASEPITIASVEPRSSAAKQGLHRGDILADVEGMQFESIMDLREVNRNLIVGDVLLMRFIRGTQIISAELQFEVPGAERADASQLPIGRHLTPKGDYFSYSSLPNTPAADVPAQAVRRPSSGATPRLSNSSSSRLASPRKPSNESGLLL